MMEEVEKAGKHPDHDITFDDEDESVCPQAGGKAYTDIWTCCRESLWRPQPSEPHAEVLTRQHDPDQAGVPLGERHVPVYVAPSA